MTKGIFITGTDTGVGKTYLAVKIAEELRARGVDVGVMKPAETGCRKYRSKLLPADAIRLSRAAEVKDSLDEVNPYRFSKPLAPSVAARLEGKRIDPKKIIRAFTRLSQKHEFMIVEGAGGILVPLADKFSYLDLARELGLPVIIVARPGLGTVNHTLLTINALKQPRIKTAGVVINYAENVRRGISERTNPDFIEKMSGVRILGIVRHGSVSTRSITDRIQSLLSGPLP